MADDAESSSMPRRPEPELMDLPEEAEAYASADFSEVHGLFVQKILEVAGPSERVDAIDLGAGPCEIPIRVALTRPGWRIVAVDGSEAMLALAKERITEAGVGERLTLLRADATRTGLPAGTFDVVFSNSILHHVADPLALWREVCRLGRPGAIVALRDLRRPATERDARRLVDLHAFGATDLLKEEFHRSLLAAYTPDEVRAQLKDAGLGSLTVHVVSDRHLDVVGQLPSS